MEQRLSGARYRLEGAASDLAIVRQSGDSLELSIRDDDGARSLKVARSAGTVHIDGRVYATRTASRPGGREIFVDLDGEIWTVSSAAGLEDAGEGAAASGVLVTPMPGLVVAVRVSAGDRVEEGEELLVLESMKIHCSIIAPFAGLVAELAVGAGAVLEKGALLVRLEKLQADTASERNHAAD